jgi:hypothetical protein
MDVLRQLDASTEGIYESAAPFFEQKGLSTSIHAPSATIEVDRRACATLWLAP